MKAVILLTPSEKTVLRTFQQYLLTPGKMLCFFGQDLLRHKRALEVLTEKEFLVRETFHGAYSLTPAGYEAMQGVDVQPIKDRSCTTTKPQKKRKKTSSRA